MKSLCIAVSGLHRGENPQPGAAIIRSLRRAFPNVEIAGLVYDIQESGIYVADGPNYVHLMPYPSAGREAFLERLDAVLAATPFDIFIPSLDAEIELLVHLQEDLEQRGIRTWLPCQKSLRRRAKAALPELAKACRVAVPETRIAHDLQSVRAAVSDLGFPAMVKGSYYEARRVTTQVQAQYTAARYLSRWGAPVVVQRCITGAEFNVTGLGDGRGGLLGTCSVRKTALSDEGKGVGGIIVDDRSLAQVTARLIGELRWRGPFEIELIRDGDTGEYHLIEINPRFPAWIDFPAQIGANFPAALVQQLLSGLPSVDLPPCVPGTFFLRHQIEVVGDVSRYGELLSQEIVANAAPSPSSHETHRLPASTPATPRIGAV